MTKIHIAALTTLMFGLVLFFLLFFSPNSTDDSSTPKPSKKVSIPTQTAIKKGVHFIAASQLPGGGFPSQMCINNKCVEDENYFTAISILLLLNNIESNATWDVSHSKGIPYIKNAMNSESLWRFGSGYLYRDVDDTALASFLLLDENISLSNKDAIISNRSPDGLFYTWIPNIAGNPKKNDIDMVVNANVILYLNSNPYHKDICDMANKLITEHKEMDNVWYYPHLLDFYLSISRVHTRKPCLTASSTKTILELINSTKLSAKTNGSDSDPSRLAKAALVTLNLNPDDNITISFFIDKLLDMQREDGGYSSGIFFLGPPPPSKKTHSWKSESLATAYVVSAMAKATGLGTVAHSNVPN